MTQVRLPTKLITDWQSFHEVCRETFGFPDFYGENMNAWIDCMSCLRDDDGMTRFALSEGEMLHIEIEATEDFKTRAPEIFDELIICAAFVNQRYLEVNEPPVLSLIFV